MAGAAALGLLGATVAEQHHLDIERIEKRNEVTQSSNVTSAVPETALQQAPSRGSSSGTPWWWWLLPLLLLPLLGLCFPAMKSLCHKSEGKTHKAKRSSLDDAECSSEQPMLDTESTSTSMGRCISPQASSLSQSSMSQGFEQSFDQRAALPALVATITPPKIKASLTPPRFVGYATPSQQLSRASSFFTEGASAAVSLASTGSSVLASPAAVVMESGIVTPTPGVVVAASPTQTTRLAEATAPLVEMGRVTALRPSPSIVVRQ
eukprot:CAMPEP_0172699222 /NCGR_PEP_ID=MMETSP1074-20121228/30025_1 /TAXON_ID=2916 /ORGANISM="Ceratium fusus, Strain PA161109" /LENGTH=263 /DNA_ID=CAMNT_0013520395 /DNA_START=488 /DNA_END=1279 /DNA_ORIENTATION=-